MGLHVEESLGSHLDILGPNGVLVRFTYTAQLPKPSWTQLQTWSGRLVTLNSPADHVHHRGMFFCWSALNGFNFWQEECAPEVTGRIVWRRWLHRQTSERKASVGAELEWLDPSGQPLVHQEVEFSAEAMVGDEAWLFCLDTVLQPSDGPVVFQTPPPYSGLGVRLCRSIEQEARVVNSVGGIGEEGTNGASASWCDCSGPLEDGGARAGVTVINHPQNAPDPVPFHTMTKGMAFISAAPTYNQAKALGPGEKWQLSFGVVVHEGTSPPDVCAGWADGFRKRPRLAGC